MCPGELRLRRRQVREPLRRLPYPPTQLRRQRHHLPFGLLLLGLVLHAAAKSNHVLPRGCREERNFADDSYWTVESWGDLLSGISPDPMSMGNQQPGVPGPVAEARRNLCEAEYTRVPQGEVRYRLCDAPRQRSRWLCHRRHDWDGQRGHNHLPQYGTSGLNTQGPFPVGPFDLSSPGPQHAADFYMTMPLSVTYSCLAVGPAQWDPRR